MTSDYLCSTSKNTTICCPPVESDLIHPRVYFKIDKNDTITCPYCAQTLTVQNNQT